MNETNVSSAQNLLDGKRLYFSFLAGAFNVFENQKMLNKMNVFPVPDADTGTNLASTFRSIVENTTPSDHIKETTMAIAEAALTGARGNSGIIIAQFLYGVSNEIEDQKEITLQNFAEAVMKAVNYAYQAIANPVEGTIITVLREWAEFIYNLKDKFETFEQLMGESLVKARESLAQTPEKLQILKKNNVVDAGAQGFVVFLEGINQIFQKENVKKILSYKTTTVHEDAVILDEHEESEFRYCTEALISLKNTDKATVKEFLTPMGDSLVMAGPDKRMRIHIHTNAPEEVFAHLADVSSILYQKVDDMVRQNEIAHRRKYDIALVIDSTCDLPRELIEEHQIHVVPLNVFFGESQFLDRLTITQEKFFHLLETSDVYPTSSQPAIKDITNTFSYLSTHYESVVALHISSVLSGTFANSKKAAEKIQKESRKPIDVMDTRQTSGAAGLIALRTAEAIANGLTHQELLHWVPQWTDKVKLFVGARSLKSFVKGGRVSPAKGFIGNLLNTKPIISVDETGRAQLFDKAFSYKGSLRKTLAHAQKYIGKQKLWGYCIFHAQDPDTANWYAQELEKLTGQKPRYIMEVSPVLAISAGIGAVGVALMLD
ncbi:MAG: DegV family protein [Bacteroidales bacterium]